jgi:hypothetical protein
MKGLCFYLFDTDRQSGTGQRLPHTLHTPHCDLLDEAPPCSLTLVLDESGTVLQFRFRSCCCKESIPCGAVVPPNYTFKPQQGSLSSVSVQIMLLQGVNTARSNSPAQAARSKFKPGCCGGVHLRPLDTGRETSSYKRVAVFILLGFERLICWV